MALTTKNVDVNKRLTIHSENGTGNCIVSAADTNDHVFEVTANYVNISGFTIVGATNNSKAGVYIDSVGHCNISDNIVSNNNLGISLDNSSCNTVTNNNANMNELANIFLYSSCCNNILTNNTASYGDGTGIYIMDDSSYNTITDNTASGNVDGICLFFYSSNNNLSSNNVNLNSDYGIYLDDSNNNRIYNNYFNNTNNAYDNGTNIWNTTTTTGPNIVGGPSIGGNYWSDYTGIDNNSNGFGDTAYNVPGGTNKDHLPLVPMCGDLDCNCIVNIMDMRLLMNHVNNPDGYPVDSWAGDVDGSGGIDNVDEQRLLTHVFDPDVHPLNCKGG